MNLNNRRTCLSDVHIPKFRINQSITLDKKTNMTVVKCNSPDLHQEFLQFADQACATEYKHSPRFQPGMCDCTIIDSPISPSRCFRGFLFDHEGSFAGGCLFQWRSFGKTASDNIWTYEDTTWWEEKHPHECWSLQWVWIDDDYRRKGILSKAWTFFRSNFGIRPSQDFFMEGSYSDDFAGFLEAQGYAIHRGFFQSMERWDPPKF